MKKWPVLWMIDLLLETNPWPAEKLLAPSDVWCLYVRVYVPSSFFIVVVEVVMLQRKCSSSALVCVCVCTSHIGRWCFSLLFCVEFTYCAFHDTVFFPLLMCVSVIVNKIILLHSRKMESFGFLSVCVHACVFVLACAHVCVSVCVW